MVDEPQKVTKKKKQTALTVVEKSTLDSLLEAMNNEYAVILRGSQVLIMRHWVGEDGTSKLIFMSKKDFLLLQDNNKFWTESDDGARKAIKIGQAWIEWPKRLSYEDIYFEPQGKQYQRRYNLWRGFPIKPKENKGKFDKFLKHIKDNICQGNEEHYNWVICWLADLFQKPARKLGTALVLRGAMGIGKGAFANHIGHLLGLHYMPITQASQLTGKFNHHMADKLLMFVDEGWWSDERNGAGILRALITEPAVTIEMKGKDAVTFQNYTRFIIAANADWVVPLGMGDERRFVMLDVGDMEKGNRAYFGAIESELKSGGYEALLHYFLNFEYNEMTPSKILMTDALCENKIYSMPDEVKWWHDCLIREKVGDFPLNNNLANDIACDKFNEYYQNWCDRMKIRPITPNVLPRKLSKMVEFNRTLKRQLDGAQYFYMLQNLSDLRAKFEQYLGHIIDWQA